MVETDQQKYPNSEESGSDWSPVRNKNSSSWPLTIWVLSPGIVPVLIFVFPPQAYLRSHAEDPLSLLGAYIKRKIIPHLRLLARPHRIQKINPRFLSAQKETYPKRRNRTKRWLLPFPWDSLVSYLAAQQTSHRRSQSSHLLQILALLRILHSGCRSRLRSSWLS